MNGLHTTLARKPTIAAAKPERYTTLRAAADTLSRRNADGAICELMNEALARLVDLAYEEDAGGLCNVDAATGKLLIPLPWGRNGHARWGVRPQEANILREILFTWQRAGVPLLFYDRSRRAWFVNRTDYPDRAVAGSWLARCQVTIAVYRAARAKRLGDS